MAKLTEAEREVIYDAARDGSAYTKPTPPAHPSALLTDLINWADAEIIEQVLRDELRRRHPDDPTYAEQFVAGYHAGQAIGQAFLAGADADALAAILEAADDDDSPITTTVDYIHEGNLNKDGIGTPTYINYSAGDDDEDEEVEICFSLNNEQEPLVYYPGCGGEVPLEQFVAWMNSLAILLADPRVQAERARWEAVGYTPAGPDE